MASDDVIYIVSDTRSGSTLLDQLLGAHPEVCTVGEVHHLVAYARLDRSMHDPVYPLQCTCGAEVTHCPFWSGVASHLQKPLSDLVLKPRFLDKFEPSRLRTRLRRVLSSALRRQKNGGINRVLRLVFATGRIAEDSHRLYDAILQHSEARYVVDASKNIDRFRILRASAPERFRLILMCRDYRGVIHSKRNRGRPILDSARTWVRTVNEMERLSRELPADRVHRLRYEDLCASPEAELQRLCAFLAIDYKPEMMVRPETDMHHIGGSPSKLQPERREIRLDRSAEGAFDPAELAAIRHIIGTTGSIWGYD